ncbi:hypothetical protein [Geobacillus thermoleovorans]|uniref:hypothetical protein n=1 Tax=Geobacillus thermoleovorans TaxID=33941 RepID=UPI003D1C11E5
MFKWKKIKLAWLTALLILLFPNHSLAELINSQTDSSSPKTQIDSKQELVQEIKAINSNPNQIENEDVYQDLVNKTDPTVLESYVNDLNEEIINAINEATESVTIDTNEETTFSKKIELPDNGYVIVEQSINIEDEPSDVVPLAADYFYFYNTSTFYSATVYIRHVLYPDTKLVLKTGFKVTTKGLTATYASVAGTSAWFPNTVDGSAQITDSTAYKEGYDINAQGDYKYAAIGIGGSGIFNSYHTIVSSVKLIDLKSNGATVRVSFKHLY